MSISRISKGFLWIEKLLPMIGRPREKEIIESLKYWFTKTGSLSYKQVILLCSIAVSLDKRIGNGQLEFEF